MQEWTVIEKQAARILLGNYTSAIDIAKLIQSDEEFIKSVNPEVRRAHEILAESKKLDALLLFELKPLNQFGLVPDHYDRGGRPAEYFGITGMGFSLMAISGAEQMGLISHDEAVQRAKLLVETLKTIKKDGNSSQGLFYQYYEVIDLGDGKTGIEKTGRLNISTVDNGALARGLLIASNHFAKDRALSSDLAKLFSEMELKAFMTQKRKS